jgi:hypothetical protein
MTDGPLFNRPSRSGNVAYGIWLMVGGIMFTLR